MSKSYYRIFTIVIQAMYTERKIFDIRNITYFIIIVIITIYYNIITIYYINKYI